MDVVDFTTSWCDKHYKWRRAVVAHSTTPAHGQNARDSWLMVKDAARDLLSRPQRDDDWLSFRISQLDISLARQVLLADRAEYLLMQVECLNRQTDGQFQGIVTGLEPLAKELTSRVQSSIGRVTSWVGWKGLGAELDDDMLRPELNRLFALFLSKLHQVGGRCAAYSSATDKKSVIPQLIDVIKREFLELIAMFQDKKWRQWRRERDKIKQVPPIELDRSHLSCIEDSLTAMRGELVVAFPSSSKTKLLQNLQASSDNVLALRIKINDFEGVLQTINTLSRTIKKEVSSIKSAAKSSLDYFKKYCDSVAVTLFWNFLPHEKHDREHVHKAEEYLAGRKLKTGLRFSHFVAAFDYLITQLGDMPSSSVITS